MKYGLLIVEGPHDVELAYRLLNPALGFGGRVELMPQLEEFFHTLVPSSFPHDDNLLKRVPVPMFMQNDSHCIAIHSARGDSRLVEAVEENKKDLRERKYQKLTGVGLILDSDDDSDPIARYTKVRNELRGLGFAFPDDPGVVSEGTPHFGGFVLPDNKSTGNLEDLLIECAGKAFPKLLVSAKTHVDTAKAAKFSDAKREDLSKNPKYKKAVVGSIATTLRPGRSIQVSVQDNIWLRGDNLKLPKIKAIQEFLKQLFELT